MRPHRNFLSCCTAAVSLLGCGLLSGASAGPPDLPATLPVEPIAPFETPFDMPQLARPDFPPRAFDIRGFGAVDDGETLNTRAIARAIAACAASGGGHVVVPRGVWLTGPIHLKSNVDLHLVQGAELRFSQRFEDYLPVVLIQRGGVRCYNYSPLVYARDCENVAVTGPGLLNGRGQLWWPWHRNQPGMAWLLGAAAREAPVEKRVFGKPQDGVRPPFVQFYQCKNVLMEGFTIKDSPSWTIHPVYCENVIIRRVTLRTVGVPNGDGIDPDSCRNVLIEHCDFDNGDDCVVLKAGRNQDAWEVGIPCENVVVRHCTMKRGHGAFTVGSEMSAGVRNVFVHHLHVDGTDRAVYLKSKPGRGGVVENIWVRDIDIERTRAHAILLSLQYAGAKDTNNVRLPAFRNVHIKNVRCRKTARAIGIDGLEQSPIENVTLENLDITSDTGAVCRQARNVVFRSVRLRPAKSSVFRVTDSVDITMEDILSRAGDTRLAVGHGARGIRLVTSDPEAARRAIRLEDGVPADAVRVEPKKER